MSVAWREMVSPQCQEDFDALLDECIDVAANNLVRNWGLDPTAIVTDSSGERSIVMADDASGRSGRAELVRSLEGSASSVRSFAIVSRVADETTDKLIEILLEHREIAIQVVFPYTIPDASTFDLGSPRASIAERRLFIEDRA